MSKLFGYAMTKPEPIITANPAWKLPKPGVEAADRPDNDKEAKPYSPEEVRAIWLATETLAASPKAILRLGLLTGQRPTEILNMSWNEISESWWTIRAVARRTSTSTACT